MKRFNKLLLSLFLIALFTIAPFIANAASFVKFQTFAGDLGLEVHQLNTEKQGAAIRISEHAKKDKEKK